MIITPLLVFSPTAERQEIKSSFNKLHTLGISGELLVRTPTTAKKDFPIKKANAEIQSEQILHNEIVQLVDTMLQLQQQKQTATVPSQQQQLAQRITYTDAKINEKIYALYGLTAEEIQLVEG